MELDDLKKTWNKAHVEPPLSGDDASTQRISRTRDARSRLISTYIRLVTIAQVMAVVIWGLDLHLSRTMLILYSGCMVALGAINYYFIVVLKRIDLNSITVSEALERTVRARILRNRLQIVSIIFCIPVVAMLLYELRMNPYWQADDPEHYAFWGGVGGAVIGAICGFIIDRRLRRQLRTMRDNLRRELDPEA